MFRRLSAATLLFSCLVFASHGQTLNFTSIPDGYIDGSISLPRAFTGALGVDPTDDQIVYASVGSFQDVNLARVNLTSGTSAVVADGPFGNIGGIAVLSATQVAVIDNSGAVGGPSDQTLLLASDLNGDGDFNDGGEIAELIPPILTGLFGWTGTQARVAPAGNPSSIPSGSVIVQSADGSGGSELLVVQNPLSTPSYRPAGAAYFSGFDYNGGFDFDSQGRIMMGTVTGSFNGNVIALVNSNADQDIDPGESNLLISGAQLPFGIADLVLDGEDDGFCATSGDVKTFKVPANPLIDSATPSAFAATDSPFLTAVLINSKERRFEPNSGNSIGATLLIGGFAAGFVPADNLLTLVPSTTSGVEHWELYP
jgi:hypothetical protein